MRNEGRTRGREAYWSVWRQRGRRFVTGANVCFSIACAAALALMGNYLAYRYYGRWNVSSRRYYQLSDRTRSVVSRLKTDVDVLVFLGKENDLYEDAKNLLREYEYEAAKSKPRRLRIDFVDPNRDLTRARELKQNFDLTEANVIVFAAGGRSKCVDAGELAEYKLAFERNQPVRKRVAFRGEQVFSSAIQSVADGTRPVIYFLTGHGERDIGDYNEQSGYSGIARQMRRDNIELKSLELAQRRAIPDDCSAIVLAGPEKKLSSAEIDILSAYLNKSGRLFLLIDPSVTTGLEKSLEQWGVKIGHDVVVGYTLTGKELVVTSYPEHPITKNLARLTTMFYMPRSVEPISPQDDSQSAQPDQPKVTALALSAKEGWAEKDINRRPMRFDPGVDRRGPVSVAVAVEKGLVQNMDVEIKPTRMVVIGDSYFAANGGLKSAIGGNVDFFMCAVNWLVARESLLAIGPKASPELRLDMTRDQIRALFLIVVGAAPGAAALIGFAVWLRRRR